MKEQSSVLVPPNGMMKGKEKKKKGKERKERKGNEMKKNRGLKIV